MQTNQMKRKWMTAGIILLFVGTCIIPSPAQNTEKQSQPTSRGNWLYVGGSGPGNYTRIQDAINDSHDGDTVFVYNGTYPGSVHINKTISLIGENKNTTIIEGSWGSWVEVHASPVLITGFTIRDFSGFAPHGGITIISGYATIIGNILTNNLQSGIRVGGSYNLITNNSIIDNPKGISLEGGSNNNTVIGNVIESCDSGVIVEFYHPSSNNTIRSNFIKNNGDGITIINGNNTHIISNVITNNSCGIYASIAGPDISFINNTIIENNTIAYNTYGIVFHDINNSYIYHNNFFKNIEYQASDDNWVHGTNNWDNGYPDGGNFWSNYTGSDDYSGPHQDIPGSDGIGDTPYEIIGFGGIDSKDRYPLMYPFGPHPEFSVSGHGGLGISIAITNTGDRNATDFGWKVTVTGGVFGFINVSENGSLDTLKIGETLPITVIPFGIGAFIIAIVVDALNAKNQSFKGHGFLVVSMVFPIRKMFITLR